MNTILLKRLGFAGLLAVMIVGGGWGLTTQSGSEILASGSAILLKSWSEIFGDGVGGGGVVIASATQSNNGGGIVSPITLARASGTVAVPKKNTKKVPADALRIADSDDVALPADVVVASSVSYVDTSTIVNISDTAISIPISKTTPPPQCSMPAAQNQAAQTAPGPVILNEIAWMGSVPAVGETAAKAGNREWIELKNISTAAVALDGWQVTDSGGALKVVFGAGDSIAAGGFYLLSRDGALVGGVAPDKAYSGALPNTTDTLAVFDSSCNVSDFLSGWTGGNNATKQTMERRADLAWQTSAAPGGTPKAENSAGVANYLIGVAIQGDGLGSVVSSPGGISCNSVALASAAASGGANSSGGASCSAPFVAGTVLTLTATPGKGATFEGWTGGCSGASKCTITVGGVVSANADFQSGLDDAESAVLAVGDLSVPSSSLSSTTVAVPSSSDVVATATTSSLSASSLPVSSGPIHLLIAQVQIAGATSGDDFVKIYNPTAAMVDMSGWKLHKKSSTGADYSLREFPQGTAIAAGAYFTWADSANGFAQSINADASSSQTLSADNSVALFDATGDLVDAVAWGDGTGQYGEGSPYPTNPASGQVLERNADAVTGVLIDTDNNAADFNLH